MYKKVYYAKVQHRSANRLVSIVEKTSANEIPNRNIAYITSPPQMLLKGFQITQQTNKSAEVTLRDDPYNPTRQIVEQIADRANSLSLCTIPYGGVSR